MNHKTTVCYAWVLPAYNHNHRSLDVILHVVADLYYWDVETTQRNSDFVKLSKLVH